MVDMLRFIRTLMARDRQQRRMRTHEPDAPTLVPDLEKRLPLATRQGCLSAEAEALPGVSCDDYA